MGAIYSFINISDKILFENADQGLLGLVFDPNYKENGYFYLNYTSQGGQYDMGKTVIERFKLDFNTSTPSLESSKKLLEIDQYYHNHNGGTMHFGADGYLYIAMGDGGHREDPLNFAQSPTELLGKMLRIDVNPDILFKSTVETENKCGQIGEYYIPSDNPFTDDLITCDETYFTGLRSPWKWSFDRLNNDVFIGDVGQSTKEEITLIPSASSGGENLGWSCREADTTLVSERCPLDFTELTEPIITYDHSVGESILGGYVYRGKEIPWLYGKYIYADTIQGKIWFANKADDQWSSQLWSETVNFIVSFGEDQAGNIYTVSYFGTISKISLE